MTCEFACVRQRTKKWRVTRRARAVPCRGQKGNAARLRFQTEASTCPVRGNPGTDGKFTCFSPQCRSPSPDSLEHGLPSIAGFRIIGVCLVCPRIIPYYSSPYYSSGVWGGRGRKLISSSAIYCTRGPARRSRLAANILLQNELGGPRY